MERKPYTSLEDKPKNVLNSVRANFAIQILSAMMVKKGPRIQISPNETEDPFMKIYRKRVSTAIAIADELIEQLNNSKPL